MTVCKAAHRAIAAGSVVALQSDASGPVDFISPLLKSFILAEGRECECAGEHTALEMHLCHHWAACSFHSVKDSTIRIIFK